MLRRLAAVAVVSAVSLTACSIFDSQHRLELDVNEKFSIKDHELVERTWEQGAVARYIGPWHENIIDLIVGPSNVVFTPVTYPDTGLDVTRDIADTYFLDSSGQHCGVGVSKLRKGEEPFSNWGLSSEERADLVSGRKELIQIESACEGSG